jgi:hypothetical protein
VSLVAPAMRFKTAIVIPSRRNRPGFGSAKEYHHFRFLGPQLALTEHAQDAQE